MQVVIDIPDKVYEMVMNTGTYGCYRFNSTKAIREGVPLPKGHGRIADIDRVMEEMDATRTYDIPFALERVKPIIEADRKGQE